MPGAKMCHALPIPKAYYCFLDLMGYHLLGNMRIYALDFMCLLKYTLLKHTACV